MKIGKSVKNLILVTLMSCLLLSSAIGYNLFAIIMFYMLYAYHICTYTEIKSVAWKSIDVMKEDTFYMIRYRKTSKCRYTYRIGHLSTHYSNMICILEDSLETSYNIRIDLFEIQVCRLHDLSYIIS